jgi:hypothetical protein
MFITGCSFLQVMSFLNFVPFLYITSHNEEDSCVLNWRQLFCLTKQRLNSNIVQGFMTFFLEIMSFSLEEVLSVLSFFFTCRSLAWDSDITVTLSTYFFVDYYMFGWRRSLAEMFPHRWIICEFHLCWQVRIPEYRDFYIFCKYSTRLSPWPELLYVKFCMYFQRDYLTILRRLKSK